MIEDARSAHPEVSVRRLCELHGVSRSWFYEQQGREKMDPDRALVGEIEAVVEEFSGYGYRRVTHELARRGRPANHKRVLRVMRERRLLCRPKRRYRATTDSNHNEARFPNLLRQVVPMRPDQVWQADLTYVRVQQGFVYLACVLDGFTREVVGWSISKFLDADLPLTALDNARPARCPAPGLLHHSDQGVQYASRVYVDRLRSAGITPSMFRTGNPYDNAKMESFYKTLKTEEVNLQEYVDLDDARRHIGSFIEDLYNRRRLHSRLGYVSPAEFAARYTAAQM
ncbi:Transposase InsO and inactivated derivatives [Deinococcus reticulitermitis]|uniref:Transposase InsO and inactivated derivatives n=1 Tax=Deinococcus reticulitermitis TaxID=856736 RepID=A0A1H7CN75_9DEIO|nr:IS3 family transposase [Deinococcus reticulitermitis]SEJ91061.1 Transposase InsO and inactivated derivatives [Deinococcus reticulitermitis]